MFGGGEEHTFELKLIEENVRSVVPIHFPNNDLRSKSHFHAKTKHQTISQRKISRFENFDRSKKIEIPKILIDQISAIFFSIDL